MHQPRSQLQCPSHRHNSCSSPHYPERSLPVIKGTIGLLLLYSKQQAVIYHYIVKVPTQGKTPVFQ